jgi:hypothetical protein
MFEVAEGDPRLGGAMVDLDATTGRALAIRRVMLDEKGLEVLRQKYAPKEPSILPPVM